MQCPRVVSWGLNYMCRQSLVLIVSHLVLLTFICIAHPCLHFTLFTLGVFFKVLPSLFFDFKRLYVIITSQEWQRPYCYAVCGKLQGKVSTMPVKLTSRCDNPLDAWISTSMKVNWDGVALSSNGLNNSVRELENFYECENFYGLLNITMVYSIFCKNVHTYNA